MFPPILSFIFLELYVNVDLNGHVWGWCVFSSRNGRARVVLISYSWIVHRNGLQGTCLAQTGLLLSSLEKTNPRLVDAWRCPVHE